MKRKVVWYECPVCKRTEKDTVRAEINKGRLVPLCRECGSYLIRKVTKI